MIQKIIRQTQATEVKNTKFNNYIVRTWKTTGTRSKNFSVCYAAIMSASDQDMSDSNLESPFSQSDSPYSSPSHQVPQLANFISELSCTESANVPRDNGPYLCIVEQPQNHFRFRYKSEMIGTHGCLLGRSHTTNKSKTHPTVELRNYTGRALIRCRLAQHISTDEHPHKLLEDDQDRDVHSWLPEKGSYRVAFRGMGIIHTAKKDVAALLYKKYSLERPGSTFDENKLRLRCENEAKNINLNIVRLKFSAHHPHSEEEMCPPVYSEWIQNMKSAATNDLKICRISRCVGRPKGGDDVFIFVEKVNKKNIMINFFELDQFGERGWSEKGKFIQSDVHHQYGIAFRTPRYENLEISSDVKVFIELVRPSDGRTSEPKEFTYKAEPIYRHNKKRKANSAFSSIESGSGSSIKSYSDLPATVEYANNIQFNNINNMDLDISKNIPVYTLKVPQNQLAPSDESMMAEALLQSYGAAGAPSALSPLLGAPAPPAGPLAGPPAGPPVLQLHSSELDRVIHADEKKQFWSGDFVEYFENLDSSINEPGAMEWIKTSMMMSDSGRRSERDTKNNDVLKLEIKEESKSIKKKIPNEYTAFYKSEDGIEVKKLVKELCEMIRNKSGYKKQVVKNKLERLFEMRLSNGDTFLHMTLSSNQPSLEYIVKLIHNMKMTKLLNLKNNLMQTILHLAIINDSPHLVSFLVSKGCNPMEEDDEGNNALHYAVICQTCLGPLLDSIKNNDVSFDINAFNNEKQTALHLSSVYGCPASVARLLAAGADPAAADNHQRTALHLAVYDDCATAVRALLRPQCDVDAVDGKGFTALQIACDSEIRENTREIVRLLLENKADPTKHEYNNYPAWKLARDKPQLVELIQKYINPLMIMDDDIKSEPEDEFDSAEEGETEPDLTALQIYIDRVAALLDNNGGWIQLMKKLQKESYQSWYSATKSPTRTLLYNLKETGEISSKSLALILEDIGQFEAANIIKACIGEC